MRHRIDKELLNKIAGGSASDSEQEIFNAWLTKLNAAQYEEVLADFEKLTQETHQPDVNPVLWEKIIQDVEAHEDFVKARKKKVVLWLSVAASLVLVTFGGLFFTNNHATSVSNLSFEQRLSNDILPGTNQAILELADGSKIVLDESVSSKIWEESGVVVKKTKDGRLLYDFEGKAGASAEPVYHTISTPNGGQYQVVLPDGTKVWLNASSRLKFPTMFEGSERTVELHGEAYFEVVSNKEKPFVVNSERESVKVLGTEFNMSVYPDDAVSKTTLLKGKVEVSPKNNIHQVKMLSPGEQSISLGNAIRVVKVDTTEAVAWKNGEFMFNRESMESVMRKIARWYNIEVIYNKPIGDDLKIWGSVSRFDNISEVLKFIERTKVVHFKVEGRKVYVMK
jgi:ferric-dicitrate binding protein FerR (iron transport regulator)